MKRYFTWVLAILCALWAANDAKAKPRATPAPTPKGPTARLIVQRAPNFGTDLAVRVLVDGAKAADIPRNQHYGGLLTARRHRVTVLALPNTQSRRPTSILVNMKPGKVYIFTATWDGDRLLLRPSDYYTPTKKANR